MIAMQPRTIPISEVAKKVRRNPSRIAQICRELDLGIMVTPRMRLLSQDEADVVQHKVKNAKTGRPKKSEKDS